MASIGNAKQPRPLPPADVIFGSSEAMQKVRVKLERWGQMNVPFLIQGECGTGKEGVARWLHACSSSAAGAFLQVACSAHRGRLEDARQFDAAIDLLTGAGNSG